MGLWKKEGESECRVKEGFKNWLEHGLLFGCFSQFGFVSVFLAEIEGYFAGCEWREMRERILIF